MFTNVYVQTNMAMAYYDSTIKTQTRQMVKQYLIYEYMDYKGIAGMCLSGWTSKVHHIK